MCYSALVKRSLEVLESKFGAITMRLDFEACQVRAKENPKVYAPAAAQIFPKKSWAPIIHEKDGERVIQPMRFSAWPPQDDRVKDRKTYNARRDNLKSPFWAPMVTKQRGLLVIEAFREWVPVAKLLQAGVVTFNDVCAIFQSERDELSATAVAQGRVYRPSITQKRPPEERQIKLDFKPCFDIELLVPVTFNWREIDGVWLPAFAMVTDDPIPFVAEAGHERSPVFLTPEAMDEWLAPRPTTESRLQALLGQVILPPLKYELVRPAVAA